MASMTPENELQQLVVDAVEALRAATGIAAIDSGKVLVKPKKLATGYVADGLLRLGKPLGDYLLVVRRAVTPAQVGAIAAHMKGLPDPLPALLVADHVTPGVAAALRERDVQFIDRAGNAWLQRDDNALIWMTGNRPKDERAHRPVGLFRDRALRVIFPLLCMPDAVNATFRDIAAWAGVALGTVANTLEELEHLGFLRKVKRHRFLENRAELMRRWVEAYPQQLRPRLKPQRFKVHYPGWTHEFPHYGYERRNLWLGGEGAAAVLTNFLHPGLITVYGEPELPVLAKELRLAKDDNGDLELLPRFWNFEVPAFDPLCEEQRFCPPLLIYADLLRTGEARQLDAAAIIKEKYLAQGRERI